MDEEFILKEHQYQQRVQYKSVRHVCHRNRIYGKSVLCKLYDLYEEDIDINGVESEIAYAA